MARILVLRPEAEARETAALAEARGHRAILLPLHEIVPLRTPPPEGRFGGFIATSAHAVPALAAAFPDEARPAFGVGGRTADRLRKAGFGRVVSGAGSADSLVEPAARLSAASGLPLLFAAGKVRMAGLETALARRGVGLVVWEVYDTRALDPGAAELDRAFEAGPPEVVLLLSAGQATGYVQLVERHPGRFSQSPRLFCLSRRIFEELPMELRGFAEISGSSRLSALFDRVL